MPRSEGLYIFVSSDYLYAHSAGAQVHFVSPLVRDFLEEHPDTKFIDQDVFRACFSRIKDWLDMSVLVGYMMKYGLLKTAGDMEELTSSYYKPQDRLNSLMKMAEAGGNDGFMLLYMCLRESASEAGGHKDAVKELDHYGKKMDHPATYV